MSNIGDSLYFIGTMWFVKEIAENPIWIGIIGFLIMLPVVLQIFFGPFIDYFSKKNILMLATGGQALIFTIITALYYMDILKLAVLVCLIFVASLLSQLSYPTETSLIPELIPNNQLTRVNSVFSFTYSSLDLICNAVAGILLTIVGIGIFYAYNAVAFCIISAIVWFFLKIPVLKNKKSTISVSKKISFSKYIDDFKEGLNCLWKLKTLRNILISFTFVNLLVCLSIGILPIISDSSEKYGFWMTAISAGMILGTMLINTFERRNLRILMILFPFISGVFWIISSILSSIYFILSLISFSISWAMLGMISVLLQTIIQVNIPEEYLGRGNTVVSAVLGLLSPLGYLLGGIVIQFIPSTWIFVISGLSLVILSIYYLVNPLFKKLVLVDRKFETDIS